MKASITFVFVFVLCGISTFVSAQSYTDVTNRTEIPISPVFKKADPSLFVQPFEFPVRGKANPGVVKKAWGQTLTVIGAVQFIVGIALVGNGSDQKDQYGNYIEDDSVTAGALLFLNGAGMIGAGIPFWIVGGHQIRKYHRQNVSFKLKGAGGALSYRF